jgi:CheY-like chemotaxis protein
MDLARSSSGPFFALTEHCKKKSAMSRTEVISTSRRIFLIGEDLDELRQLCQKSPRLKLKCVARCDGKSALDMILADPPDIVVIQKKGFQSDGLTICRVLKSISALAHIPVIFMGATNLSANIQDAFDAGCAAYFVEPFNPQLEQFSPD